MAMQTNVDSADEESESLESISGCTQVSLSQKPSNLLILNRYRQVSQGKRYKKVAKRVKPIPGTLPDQFRITRRQHANPLRDIPVLPTRPPPFVPGKRYTKERYENTEIDPDGFLWPEERKLAHYLFRVQEDALAWIEIEKGRFDEAFFDPVRIRRFELVVPIAVVLRPKERRKGAQNRTRPTAAEQSYHKRLSIAPAHRTVCRIVWRPSMLCDA